MMAPCTHMHPTATNVSWSKTHEPAPENMQGGNGAQTLVFEGRAAGNISRHGQDLPTSGGDGDVLSGSSTPSLSSVSICISPAAQAKTPHRDSAPPHSPSVTVPCQGWDRTCR